MTDKLRVVATGSRHFSDASVVRRALGALPPGSRVAHGACIDPKTRELLGADKLVDEIAREMGFEVERYPANWTEYGPAAGPIRNRRMVLLEQPDVCLAFLKPELPCRGTNGCIKECRRQRGGRCEIREFME